jgi:hypothetical protein
MYLSALSWKLSDKIMFTYSVYKQAVLTQKLTGLQSHNSYELWCVQIMSYPLSYPSNLRTFHLIWALVWQFNVPGSNNKHYTFIKKDRYFCPILTKFGISQPIFMKFPNIKFHENLSCGTCPDICRQADRQTNTYDGSNIRHVCWNHKLAAVPMKHEM